MTEDLSTAFRRSVTAAVETGTDPAALLRGVERSRSALARRDRRRAVAAAVMAVVAVAGIAVLPELRRDEAAPPVATVDVPAGSQAVSWHGVQVVVPESWQLDDQRCGVAQTSTVLLPGFRNSCLPPYVPELTVVEFAEIPDIPATTSAEPLLDAATTPLDLDGTPALTGSVPLEQETGVRRVLVVPSEGVIVTVRSPDAAAADRILATARVVVVDANGCPARIPTSRPAGPSGVEGASESLLPGSPTSLSACRYERLRLVSSRRVDASISALQQRLDALATGVSGRTPEREIAEELCRGMDDEVTTLEAGYADDRSLRVFFRGQACTDRSALNGSTTRRTDRTLISDLYSVLAGRPMTLDTERTAARPQPAPELGYEQVGTLSATGRADLLAGTDSAAQLQLLGLVRPDGTRCVVAKRPAQTDADEVSCGPTDWLGADRVTVAIVPSTAVLVGVTEPQTRTVRVIVDGRHVGTWATFGGGSAYDQRRFFLGQLPAGAGRVEVTGLDSLGNVTSTASLIR